MPNIPHFEVRKPWITLETYPYKHAISCQYRACTGPMLVESAQDRPGTGTLRMFMGKVLSKTGKVSGPSVPFSFIVAMDIMSNIGGMSFSMTCFNVIFGSTNGFAQNGG